MGEREVGGEGLGLGRRGGVAGGVGLERFTSRTWLSPWSEWPAFTGTNSSTGTE